VISLYTKDDCFGLVLDSEEELEDWLKALLSQQYGEDIVDGEEPKPTFGECCCSKVIKKRHVSFESLYLFMYCTGIGEFHVIKHRRLASLFLK
jgi:hypothetical protein